TRIPQIPGNSRPSARSSLARRASRKLRRGGPRGAEARGRPNTGSTAVAARRPRWATAVTVTRTSRWGSAIQKSNHERPTRFLARRAPAHRDKEACGGGGAAPRDPPEGDFVGRGCDELGRHEWHRATRMT